MLLTQTLRVTGLGRGCRRRGSDGGLGGRVHDPGKIITDLAVALALGATARPISPCCCAEPELFGPVASDPVVSRLVTRLAADAPRALRALRGAPGLRLLPA